MRDVVYFHGHGMTRALLVLGIWAIVGATVVIAVNVLRANTGPAIRIPRATPVRSALRRSK
ncbi:MAG: hypothetical protein JWN81_960 [Solirubrobacterales bacterium]|jgi:hypothetical protein|nr:hypothetical protein [Solirubrobacterales bacterium]